ncbi:MAG: 3'-5' exonuclease, partial [archaeon]
MLQESGFYNYAGAMPGGRQRQANLRILVDRARQFASNSEQSLFNYIRYIERLEEQLDNETGTARLINENEDVVRLMSIHKSKGLEFPVVIVADLGKRFNTNDLKGSLLLHRELGLGPKFVDPEKRIYNFSLPQLAIKERKRRENLSEELRILYVALTRAVDRLILFGTASNLENRSKKWLRGSNKANLINAGSMLDWICSALAAHPGGKTIRELPDGPSQIPSINENTIESKWHINVYTRESLEIENLEESEDFLEKKKSLKEGFAGTTGRKSTQINNEDSKNIDYTRNDQITKDHISKSHITKDYITKDQVRDLKNEIKRRMEWQYPYRAAEGLPSKMSVTEIKDISVDEKDFAESGKVFYEPGQQTGNRDNQVSDVRVNIRKDIVSDSKLPGLPELSDLE